MVANMKVGSMDAFCVGVPWNEERLRLSATARLYDRRHLEGPSREEPRHARRLGRQEPQGGDGGCCKAVLEAAQWCDKLENAKEKLADHRGQAPVVRTRPPADIVNRIKGEVNYGDGRKVDDRQAVDEVLGAITPPIRSRATNCGSSRRTSAGA